MFSDTVTLTLCCQDGRVTTTNLCVRCVVISVLFADMLRYCKTLRGSRVYSVSQRKVEKVLKLSGRASLTLFLTCSRFLL